MSITRAKIGKQLNGNKKSKKIINGYRMQLQDREL